MSRAVSVLILALAACKPAGGSTNGREVFHSVCATCHGMDGKPDGANAARGVRDLTSPEFRKRVTPALVEAQVRHGSQNKLMPAFEGALQEAQIKAVAAFVASSQFPN